MQFKAAPLWNNRQILSDGTWKIELQCQSLDPEKWEGIRKQS